jgi:site-specific DNA-methyltransferase (cytosine-N4-specific)
MTVHAIVGDVCNALAQIHDNTIQCVVTSPPYFGLRSYLDKDDPDKQFEIGTEKTPAEYVAKMVTVFREIRRVLHPAGVAFLNLGDSYASNTLGGPNSNLAKLADQYDPRSVPRVSNRDDAGDVNRQSRRIPDGFKQKDLLMIPARVAIALQDDGWYLRSQIAWTKNKVMPESAKDRPTSAWESIFVLTKEPSYFWDYEGAKEDSTYAGTEGGTRNMRNVWQINPASFPGKHFATFPPELPRRAIQASTSDHGCCPYCRTPYARVVQKGDPDLERQRACGGDVTGAYNGKALKDYAAGGAQNASDVKRRILAGMVKKTTIGWERMCSGCPDAAPIPCIVLDPFGGSGTTCMVANMMGRDALMIDLKADYVRLAIERISTGR